ncbi:Uncharacterised protein [Pseudomonas fluorescens]|uniref:Uncharacterized protein n=1 Tax=Pseudomonas fluorescens TaxID=294 RepID=A0A379ICN7_PSEFL|nr:hypothetical protein HZ99_01980 [Pseudomonas fluorescens]SUD30617.1 Uncharacterised protein [Pseudomonas fluorescens]
MIRRSRQADSYRGSRGKRVDKQHVVFQMNMRQQIPMKHFQPLIQRAPGLARIGRLSGAMAFIGFPQQVNR